MKKIGVVAFLLSIFLVACGEKKVEGVKDTAKQVVQESTEFINKISGLLNFKSTDGDIFSLVSNDSYETAVLKTADGKEINLKRELTENGIKLVGENGVEINFNEKDGILKLDGKEYQLNVLEENIENITTNVEILNFKSTDNTLFALETPDFFETAILKTADGKEINLKRELTENGIKLVGENGVEINFNENNGILKLDGKEYQFNFSDEAKGTLERIKDSIKNFAGNIINNVKEATNEVKTSVENLLNQTSENSTTKEKIDVANNSNVNNNKSASAAKPKKNSVTNSSKKSNKNTTTIANNKTNASSDNVDLSKAEIIVFKTPAGITYRLETLDLFETATLKNYNGEIINLKNNGSKLVGENGVEVYLNDENGYLHINGKEYMFKK